MSLVLPPRGLGLLHHRHLFLRCVSLQFLRKAACPRAPGRDAAWLFERFLNESGGPHIACRAVPGGGARGGPGVCTVDLRCKQTWRVSTLTVPGRPLRAHPMSPLMIRGQDGACELLVHSPGMLCPSQGLSLRATGRGQPEGRRHGGRDPELSVPPNSSPRWHLGLGFFARHRFCSKTGQTSRSCLKNE